MTVEITLTLEDLRNTKGSLLVCLTQDRRHFPNCKGDPNAIRKAMPAASGTVITLSGVVPGRYAVSVIHDENRNGKLDTALGIPREGFGFSHNPALRFGPPRFEEVLFTVGNGKMAQSIRIRYLL